MKIRYLTAAGVFAAMIALAGCGSGEETWEEDNTTTTETWDDQTRTEPMEPATPAGQADETWQYDPETQETVPADDAGGMAGTEPEPTTTMPETGGSPDVDMTEFAALDTDSSGSLTEEQWVPEALGGVEFSDVDQDGDGTVTREEFRRHFVEGGAGAGSEQSPTPQ